MYVYMYIYIYIYTCIYIYIYIYIHRERERDTHMRKQTHPDCQHEGSDLSLGPAKRKTKLPKVSEVHKVSESFRSFGSTSKSPSSID